ncbi:hypothetical protein N7530_008909 [Penicillium desertorum]|uniref:Uncharacterized protein n=1 Tax=Penicillium desertorum TaxID=1303715 RepID=A0A9W9WPZ4_9EURO|nr:hypothetical protein N7530_008909 [Penicillium desertorum]
MEENLRSLTPIKQHILGISNFIREIRLQVGITDLPPLLTPRASPNPKATRGSYRFLPTPKKRSRADYKGLDVPSHKKKKRNKAKSNKATTKDMAQEADDAVAAREGDISAEPPSTTEANAAMSIPQAGMSLTDMYTYRGEKAPRSIVEDILVNCIKLNDPLGRYGHRSKQANMTTKVEEIQSFVDDIVKLQYPDAVQLIKQENAFSASKSIQSRFNETVYWEIIKKGAELLDPKDLPISKGPLDEFTMAEKVATERFMREAGYGLSLANQRQCRLFWKRLFEMRNAGVYKILLYRTKEFDRFCKSYSSEAGASLVRMVRDWEEKYGFHIKQLEERVAEESKGDLTGRLWLSQPLVADRLSVPEVAWNSAILQRRGNSLPTERITRTVSCTARVVYGIPGPEENLWLDYSTVTGVLNFMRVSAPGGDSNVRLQWELIDGRSEGQVHLMWRVSVVALRAIQSFEEIVRAAPQKEQYLLHQSPACAKRGYTKYRSF